MLYINASLTTLANITLSFSKRKIGYTMKIQVTLEQMGIVKPLMACVYTANGETKVMLLPSEGVILSWLRRGNHPNGAADLQDATMDLKLARTIGVERVAIFVINDAENSTCTYSVESTINPNRSASEFTDLRRRLPKGCIPVVNAFTNEERHDSIKHLMYPSLTTAMEAFELPLVAA